MDEIQEVRIDRVVALVDDLELEGDHTAFGEDVNERLCVDLDAVALADSFRV